MTQAPPTVELVLFEDGPQQAHFDLDQCRDIATHGMAQGVSGFIYNHNLYEWFNENSEEIESFLNDWIKDTGLAETYIQHIGKQCEDHLDLKAKAVWMYVELQCYAFVSKHDPEF